MKMLKRAGAIAIAGAMALSLGSVAYAADPTITVGTIDISPAEDGIVTVTVPYTAENLATGAQVTLLAELGAAEKVYASNIVYDTTAYIDQDAAGSAFTFKINENRLTGTKDADVWLNVKVGGTGVATAAEGSVLAYDYVEAPKTPITSEEVKGALEVDSTNAVVTNVYGLANAGIMRLDATDLIAVDENGKATLDLATQVVKVDGVEASYTVYNGVTKLIAFVDTAKAEHTIEIVAKDGGSTQLKYGDSNLDAAINVVDVSAILNRIFAPASMSALTEYSYMTSDPNGDKAINVVDVSATLNLILDPTLVPDADK